MRYLPIIGLEVHAQLKTESKMFCSCPNTGDEAPPNTAICPICTGQPGALPALNEKSLELGIKTALALNCQIPDKSAFDRKNYFYPDLPKGYQISQFHLPIAINGYLEFDVPGNKPPREHVKIRIIRAHLEEDAAKNIHARGGDQDEALTFVDFNRSGTPLLEIVSDADLRNPLEAKTYLQELRGILRAIGASDADMEKGQMRCDANISLLPVDDENHPLQSQLNPKVEVKNLNSFRSVEHALAYEIERQGKAYASSGTPPVDSTRGWDEDKGMTFEQRTKETSADYRYFPEPDLPPQDLVELRERLKNRLPELPSDKRSRLGEEWGFSPSDVAFLVGNQGWAEYAEQVMGELGGWLESTDSSDKSGGELLTEKKKRYAKLAGGWLTSKLAGLMTERSLDIANLKITAEDFAELLNIIATNQINSTNALKLLKLMLDTGTDPSHLMEEHNLGQNMSEEDLKKIVERLVEQNPDQVAQIKVGKTAVLKWFVGAVMKATEGKANPEIAEDMVKKEIGS
ncbi:MAG: Asp-tRNA(Asn)/Glu-tRNA(Gln) amidotransferase subunit GatB [Patescibacteria group bacterium]